VGTRPTVRLLSQLIRPAPIVALIALALAATGCGGAKASADSRGETLGSAGLIAFVAGNPTDVYVVRPNGKGRRPLTQTPKAFEWCPSWSPDGKSVAASQSRGQRTTVELLNAKGKRLWQLAGGSCSGWSPDGTRLLLERADGLYVVGGDGKNLHKVVSLDSVGGPPSWSPRGDEIAYPMSQDDGDNDQTDELTIVVKKVDGEGERHIRIRPPGWCASDGDCRIYHNYFEWAPGNEIAFTLVSGDLYPQRLYAVNDDGSGMHVLSGALQDVYWPRWSPDGGRIAFVYRNKGNDQVWSANMDGVAVRQLARIKSHTGNLSGCYDPVWSADAKDIFCYGWAGGMYIVDSATGSARLLTRNASTAEPFEPPASSQPLP